MFISGSLCARERRTLDLDYGLWDICLCGEIKDRETASDKAQFGVEGCGPGEDGEGLVGVGFEGKGKSWGDGIGKMIGRWGERECH